MNYICAHINKLPLFFPGKSRHCYTSERHDKNSHSITINSYTYLTSIYSLLTASACIDNAINRIIALSTFFTTLFTTQLSFETQINMQFIEQWDEEKNE